MRTRYVIAAILVVVGAVLVSWWIRHDRSLGEADESLGGRDTAVTGTLPAASALNDLTSLPIDQLVASEKCTDMVFGELSRRRGFSQATLNSFLVMRETVMARMYGMPLSGRDNELHDCQRIYLSDTEETLAGLTGFATLSNPDATPKPVIGVYLYDRPYSPLKLSQEKSCIFAKVEMKNNKLDWTAWVVPMRPTDGACRDLDISNGSELDVFQLKEKHGSNGPYGVRWEESEGEYYIGFKCLDEWCVLHGQQQKKPKEDDIATDARGDDQTLSWLDGGRWKRSGLRASIRPYDGATDTLGYKHVANITFRKAGPSPPGEGHYADKVLKTKTNGILPNVLQVYLLVDTATATSWIRYGTLGDPIKGVYLVGDMKSGKGTVRWRWSEKDERAWIQCAAGCCGEPDEDN